MLEVEYLPAVVPPEAQHAIPHDDWCVCTHCCPAPCTVPKCSVCCACRAIYLLRILPSHPMLRARRMPTPLPPPQPRALRCCAYRRVSAVAACSPSQAASGSYDGSVRLWDGACLLSPCLPIPAVAPRQRLAVHCIARTCGAHSIVCTQTPCPLPPALRADKAQCVGSFTAHAGGVTCMAAVAGGGDAGPLLVTGGRDYELHLWRLSPASASGSGRNGASSANEAGSLVAVYRGHEGEVACVAASPSGAMCCSGGWDGQLLLWRAGACVVPSCVGEQGVFDGSVLAHPRHSRLDNGFMLLHAAVKLPSSRQCSG